MTKLSVKTRAFTAALILSTSAAVQANEKPLLEGGFGVAFGSSATSEQLQQGFIPPKPMAVLDRYTTEFNAAYNQVHSVCGLTRDNLSNQEAVQFFKSFYLALQDKYELEPDVIKVGEGDYKSAFYTSLNQLVTIERNAQVKDQNQFSICFTDRTIRGDGVKDMTASLINIDSNLL